MSHYTYDYRAGRIETGSWDAVFIPSRLRRPDIEPVCIFHGANAPGLSTSDTAPWAASWPNVHRLAATLALMGIPVVGGYMGGNAYANDAISGDAATSFGNKALDLAKAASGTTATKMHAMGLSMGGGVALRWASLNQAKAASVVGFIPMVSILNLYQDNPNMFPAAQSFTAGIATAWGLPYRTVTDAAITAGSNVLTSGSANFTSGDVGKSLVRGYDQTGIPPNTKVQSVTNSTTIVMTKNAISPGGAQNVTIATALPMSGTAGADLIGVHAPRLASASIPSRFYYASDDPYIYPTDVTAAATASGGVAYNAGPFGHDDDVVAWARTQNGGSNFEDLIGWMFPE